MSGVFDPRLLDSSSDEGDFTSSRQKVVLPKHRKKAAIMKSKSALKRTDNKKAATTRTKTSRPTATGVDESSGNDVDDIVKVIASKKAQAVALPPGVRGASDLKWWRDDGRYYPCRICDADESMYINLDPNWDVTEVALIQALEFPPTKPFDGRDRILVDLGSLRSYGSRNVWDRGIWDSYSKERQLEAKQRNKKLLLDTDVKAGYLYLNRILKAAKEKDVPEECFDNDDNSDLEIPYEVNLKLPDKTHRRPMHEFSDKKKEPLRPGDTIQYCSPIYCAGDPRGLRTATVLSTNPMSKGYIIQLSNQEMLPNETRVKRIKELKGDKQYTHNGFYRSIEQFVMKKRSLNVDQGDLTKQRSEQIGRIVDRNIDKLRKTMEDEGLPADFVQDFKSRRKQVAADKAIQRTLQRKKKSPAESPSSIEDASSLRSQAKKGTTQAKKKVSECLTDSSTSSEATFKGKHSPVPTKSHQVKNKLSSFPKKSRDTSSDSDSSLEVLIKTLTSPKAKASSKETSSYSSESESDSSLSQCNALVAQKLDGKTLTMAGPSESDSGRRRKEFARKDASVDVYNGDNSESSMSNQGLDLRSRAIVPIQRKQSSPRAPIKTVTIDRKTKYFLPAKRRYLPDMIEKDKKEASTVFSKVNSRKANSHAPKATEAKKGSISLRQKNPLHNIPSALDRSMSGNEDNERSSQGSNCADIIAPTKCLKELRGASLSGERLKDRNGRARPKDTGYIRRVKQKAPYRVKEDDDDIEDSDGDKRGRTPTSKYGKYKPVAHLSSASKSRKRGSIESYASHSKPASNRERIDMSKE